METTERSRFESLIASYKSLADAQQRIIEMKDARIKEQQSRIAELENFIKFKDAGFKDNEIFVAPCDCAECKKWSEPKGFGPSWDLAKYEPTNDGEARDAKHDDIVYHSTQCDGKFLAHGPGRGSSGHTSPDPNIGYK